MVYHCLPSLKERPAQTYDCDVCCIQRSSLHVMLQLLGMRAAEASQHLLHALSPSADALPRTSQHLSAWLAILQEASAAMKRAQSAHAETARLQVGLQNTIRQLLQEVRL